MGGSCGRERLAGPARYANPHESAHPIGAGRAEKINRLARSHSMKRTSKGAPAPFVVISDSPMFATYIGTKEQLIAGGFARPEQFPEARKRVKWDYSMDNFRSEGWEVRKLKGDLFRLKRNHEHRPTYEQLPFLKNLEIRYQPNDKSDYIWRIQLHSRKKLDEQAVGEIKDAIQIILDAVDDSEARAKNNHLRLVRPATATGGAR